MKHPCEDKFRRNQLFSTTRSGVFDVLTLIRINFSGIIVHGNFVSQKSKPFKFLDFIGRIK